VGAERGIDRVWYNCGGQGRARELLQAKYERIAAGFSDGAAEIRSALEEVQGCFELLRANPAPAEPPPSPAAAGDAGADEDWEDVAAPAEEGDNFARRCMLRTMSA